MASTPPTGRRLDPAFASRLHGRVLDDLDAHPGAVYGLYPDGRLGYLNPAWFRFARENGADPEAWPWQLGARLADAIPAPLEAFYAGATREVLTTGDPWEHAYECSSPTERRVFRMRMMSLDGDGLLVVNNPVVVEPHAEGLEDVDPDDPRFRDARTGMVVQCAHCRCVRQPGPGTWTFVPAFVARPPMPVSHGLCPACLAYHYPRAR